MKKSNAVKLDLKTSDVVSLIFLAVAVHAAFMGRLDVASTAIQTLTDGVPLLREATFLAIALLLISGILNAVMIVLKLAIDLIETIDDEEPRDPNYGAQP